MTCVDIFDYKENKNYNRFSYYSNHLMIFSIYTCLILPFRSNMTLGSRWTGRMSSSVSV